MKGDIGTIDMRAVCATNMLAIRMLLHNYLSTCNFSVILFKSKIVIVKFTNINYALAELEKKNVIINY